MLARSKEKTLLYSAVKTRARSDEVHRSYKSKRIPMLYLQPEDVIAPQKFPSTSGDALQRWKVMNT